MHKYYINLGCYFFIGIIFFYFVYLAPYMTDNYVFSLEITPGFAAFYHGDTVSAQPMTLGGALRQAREMYFTWCGRFAGNLCVYTLFMLPHVIYCFLAAFIFPFYVFLLQLCIFGRNWRIKSNPKWIFAIFAMLWLGMPSFGEAFFWLSVGGQIAMFAQACIFVPYRFALDDLGKKQEINKKNNKGVLLKIFWSILLFFGGILTCSLDYPTSAALPPTALIFLIYIYWKNKAVFYQKMLPLISCVFGLWIGSGLTLLAPGNAERIKSTNEARLQVWLGHSWPERVWDWLSQLPQAVAWEWLPLALLIFSCIIIRRHDRKNWIKSISPAAWLFLLPAVLTVGAFFFTAWPPARAFATCTAQLIICAAIVFITSRKYFTPFTRKSVHCAFVIFICCCAASLAVESVRFYSLHKVIEQRTVILTNSKNGTAILPELDVDSNSHQPLGGALSDLSVDPDFWVNRAMATYYGLNSIQLETSGKFICNLIKDESKLDKPDIYAILNEIEIAIDRDRIEIKNKYPYKLNYKLNSDELHIYYSGSPGILSMFPKFLRNYIIRWLGKKDDWRVRIVPLFCPRVDIKTGENYTRILKIEDNNTLWLVSPGESKYSFDLLQLRCKLEK